MSVKKTSTKPTKSVKKSTEFFASYEEAMEKLFPETWKEEKREKIKIKRKEMPMDELARSIMSAF